jgi:hypothetical protein
MLCNVRRGGGGVAHGLVGFLGKGMTCYILNICGRNFFFFIVIRVVGRELMT